MPGLVECECEHAVEFFESAFAPVRERFEQNFCVARTADFDPLGP